MLPNNPLQQYFRQPSIYIKLPSQGQFYPEGTLDMPPNGEIPVYPMTAIDEISYRTPDALFNGSAVISVMQSCVPNIKNCWAIPAVDVDTILISIRIASYGHEMEVATKCPKCGEDAEHGLDLRSVLDRMKAPDYQKVLKYGDMEFYFKPLTYKDLNDNNQTQFEEQRALQTINSVDTSDEDKITAMSKVLKKITEITVNAMALSISAVKTPTALVTERAFIDDLLKNCDRKLFAMIRDHVLALKSASEIQPMTLKCGACSNEYQQAITLDMSSFFEDAS
jgi:bacterioferritin-associated ferredoxin